MKPFVNSLRSSAFTRTAMSLSTLVPNRAPRAWLATALALVFAGCGRPEGTLQMPPQGSNLAAEVDWLFYFIFWTSVISFVLIIGAMLWFTYKYRRREGHSSTPTGHATVLELFWTFSPLILLWFLFQWGFDGYIKGAIAPANAIEMRVTGKQWAWDFEYPNGAVKPNVLWVPVSCDEHDADCAVENRHPVKLLMSSADVLHSFYVPEFRVKRDVIPGMYSTLWFEATRLGAECTSDEQCGDTSCIKLDETQETGRCGTQVFCAEYCGAPPGAEGNAGHSNMLAQIRVSTLEEYETFLEKAFAPPAECETAEDPKACWGEKLYVENGCNACHGNDGTTQAPAPNFKGLFGTERVFVDGSKLVADENYIRESILQPQAQIRAGYNNVVMPPFQFVDAQVDAIIAYMKQLNAQ